MSQIIQIAENPIPYWSRFVVDYDLRYDGVTPLRTLFTKGSAFYVFNYQRGASQVTALGGAVATFRDTILVTPSQTRGGAMYNIRGLEIVKDGGPVVRTGNDKLTHELIFPTAEVAANGAVPQISVEDFRGFDYFSWSVFAQNTGCVMQIDGTTRVIEWGPTMNYPGVGGPADGNVASTTGALVGNHARFDTPIEWNPSGSGDSNLVVTLTFAYNVVAPTFTAPDGLAPNGAPIPDAVPTPIGRQWSQGWIVRLVGEEIAPTSNVA